VADEVGLANLTLTAIAPRLGVRMPSLYKHVASVDALKRLVAIQATREMADIFARAAAGKSEADAFAAIASAWREWASIHPGRYAATVRAPERGDADHTAAADDVLQIVLAVLAGYALRGDDAIDGARAFRSALHGFISLEYAGAFGLPVDVDRSFDRLVAGLSDTLRSWTLS
jgi:AcrR family transcriptional regulator